MADEKGTNTGVMAWLDDPSFQAGPSYWGRSYRDELLAEGEGVGGTRQIIGPDGKIKTVPSGTLVPYMGRQREAMNILQAQSLGDTAAERVGAYQLAQQGARAGGAVSGATDPAAARASMTAYGAAAQPIAGQAMTSGAAEQVGRVAGVSKAAGAAISGRAAAEKEGLSRAALAAQERWNRMQGITDWERAKIADEAMMKRHQDMLDQQQLDMILGLLGTASGASETVGSWAAQANKEAKDREAAAQKQTYGSYQ
jgi:hypothetical protein